MISLIEKRCNKLSNIIQVNAKKHFKLKEVIVKPNYSRHNTKDILAQGKIANKARNKLGRVRHLSSITMMPGKKRNKNIQL